MERSTSKIAAADLRFLPRRSIVQGKAGGVAVEDGRNRKDGWRIDEAIMVILIAVTILAGMVFCRFDRFTGHRKGPNESLVIGLAFAPKT